MRLTRPLGEFVKGWRLGAELLLAIHFTGRDRNRNKNQGERKKGAQTCWQFKKGGEVSDRVKGDWLLF